ncbi:GspH/FimT family protein [Photobacterium leiognathi]|nr:GspH/FimT family protein [Photobacterium leiognathi]
MHYPTEAIHSLIVAAKSEAVMRGTDVYLHIIDLTSTKTLTDNRCHHCRL